MRFPYFASCVLVLFLAAGCQPPDQTDDRSETPASDDARADEAVFEELADDLVDRLLALNPEWAIRQGHYDNAAVLTIPDAEYRRRVRDYAESGLERLGKIDRSALSADKRVDYDLIENRLESMLWYQETFRSWQWMPSRYNVAGPLNILLNTRFAPEPERLGLICERLSGVPDFYQAARQNVDRPTLEHTELAISQSQGTLSVLDDISERIAESEIADPEEFEQGIEKARAAVEDWIDWLESLHQELEAEGDARDFRIGRELYQQKFEYDIQSSLTAEELYQRALEEKDRLHAEMAEQAANLWPEYFPDEDVPGDEMERIARLIDRLSERHVEVDEFVDEIRSQMPELEEFVRDNDLLFQDPDKPLVVRETPEYMRGTGAIASVSAPGPFDPDADTYYNVTPLDHYGPELAQSYLREYNHWMLQILNIHEGIPGHYTQLLHANRSPSLIKSLFGNGAMVEGWAVYAERMMLEEGWGDYEPELWLMHGKWLLRVTVNTILDYSVHVLGMEREEAIEMLRDEAFQEMSEATQKWRRVKLSQVQLTSYFAGYAEIYDLRERLKEKQGEDFNLKTFHNEFLGYGSAPVSTIAELMGVDPAGSEAP